MIQSIFNKKTYLFADQMLFSGSSFCLNIALVKVLDLTHYGIFASLVIIMYLLLSIVHALVVQPMQIQLGKTTHTSSYKSFLLILLLLLIGVFLVIIHIVFLSDLPLLATYKLYLIPFSAYLVVFLCFDFFRKFFLAKGQVLSSLIMGMIYSLLGLVGFTMAIYSGSTELNYLVLVLSAAYIPALIFAVITYSKDKLSYHGPDFRRYFKTHIIEGQWLLYASFVQWLSNNLFVMTSGMLVSLEALGALRFIQTLFGVVNIALQTVENYALPQLSKAYRISQNHFYNKIRGFLGKAQLYIFIGAALLFFFSKQLVIFIGSPEFESYHFIMKGMVLLYLIILIGYPVRLLVRITELNKIYFIAYFSSFIFSALSYHFLLTHFGIMGAISGIIINQLILQVTWLVALNKKQFKIWKLYI